MSSRCRSKPLPPNEALKKARELIDAGRPFAAHEVLEARWKAAPTEEGDLWQGLAQVCVAQTRSARGNLVGAELLSSGGLTGPTRGESGRGAARPGGSARAAGGAVDRLDDPVVAVGVGRTSTCVDSAGGTLRRRCLG
ncbi:DUF309 domain-containing protein [Dermatophilaceae bacterium Soc4.6]